MVTGVIYLFIGLYTEGNAKEKPGNWVLYGKSAVGDYFFDKNSVSEISPGVFKVSEKIKYSKLGKDQIIQSKQKTNNSIKGFDKLDNGITLYNFDCGKNTVKAIKYTDYNDKWDILEDSNIPNPKTEQISADALYRELQKRICPK